MWFQFTRETNKRNMILYGGASVAVFVLSLLCGVHWAVALGGGALLYAVLFFPLSVSARRPTLGGFVILAAQSVIIFVLMQITISCGVFLIGVQRLILNLLIVLGISSFFWIFTGSVRVSSLIVLISSTVIAVADHLVVQARSFEIQFSDLRSIATAATVAGGYSFSLSVPTAIGLMLSICFAVFLVRTEYPRRRRGKSMLLLSLTSVAVMGLCVFTVYTQIGASFFGYQDKYWKYRGSERNGFWVNIIYSASATRVQVPQGYDPNTLTEKLSAALPGEEEPEPEPETARRPNVIVIMNETFSDVHNIASYLGYEMPVSQPVTPFLDSLSNDMPGTVKGHALVSVYGGNTANSELEFLSGLSMQFVPRNTVAYNLYINENNSFTMVDLFRNAGYHTFATHPEDRTNWQRDKIYDYFGFDETCFLDGYAGLSEEDYYRDHVSDAAVYDKVIEAYESKDPDAPLFAFAVTMQNHGGFSSFGFEPTVTLEGYEKYTGIQEYLSSIHTADAALQEFVAYFDAAEEDTLIVFYGDHQPSLPNIATLFFGGAGDDSEPEEQLAKYTVPYFFHANYDLTDAKENLPEGSTELTSLNFLSTHLLRLLGMQAGESRFLQYVDTVHGEVMAMNAMGWYDYDRVFHPSTYNAPELSGALRLYSALQYNALYDDGNRIRAIFTMKQ